MSAWFRRMFCFMRFTLLEYIRSGRILVESTALVIVIWVFFWSGGRQGIDGRQFFHLGGIFVLAITFYTTTVIMGLGSRPQSYIVLARPIGRRGYLCGLYMTALVVVTSVFLMLSVAVFFINPPTDLSVRGWLLGGLPLLLDVAILAAFITLLAPLVLSAGMRLLVLGLLALVLNPHIDTIGGVPVYHVLDPVQTLLSLPLLPAMSGFELAVRRNYDVAAAATLLGQLALTAALLTFALSAFERRELILSS